MGYLACSNVSWVAIVLPVQAHLQIDLTFQRIFNRTCSQLPHLQYQQLMNSMRYPWVVVESGLMLLLVVKAEVEEDVDVVLLVEGVIIPLKALLQTIDTRDIKRIRLPRI